MGGRGIKIELTFICTSGPKEKDRRPCEDCFEKEGKINVKVAVGILGGWEGDKNRIDFVCASGPNAKRPPGLRAL